MVIKANETKYEPCPEFNGRAVCVDVTPLRKQAGLFGEREVFKLVFEVDLRRADGSRYCVWTHNFRPTLNERSNFRKFLRAWFGRDLTEAELGEFNTEMLIGKPAELMVVHEHKDGETYANILTCLPDRSESPLVASGQFVRTKDRQSPNGRVAPASAAEDTEALPTAAEEPLDPFLVQVHVGRHNGRLLRDLMPASVQDLCDRWLPLVKQNPNPSPEDRRLMAALESWLLMPTDAEAY